MSFREILRQHPFLRILLPLIIGIFLAEYVSIDLYWFKISLFLSFLLALLLVLVPFFCKSYSLRHLFGIVAFFLFVNLGAFRTANVQKDMFLNCTDSCIYKINLLDQPLEKANSYVCSAQIETSIKDEMEISESAKVLLYFQKDSSIANLQMGDCLLLQAKLNRVRNAGNPNEFDFAHYIKGKHILYSSYIKRKDFIAISAYHKITLRTIANQWRNHLLQIYRDQGIENENFDILAALSLGYKSSLDPETRQAWADAGAMHVLAVSGLHVGIIYFVMNLLFGFLKHIRFGTFLRLILLLVSLWGYAFITGLSPSVLRAACMFSFVVIGDAVNRKGSVFNLLAASAFLLLLFDPYLIFAVGFQFSYLAVAGILYLQPKFNSLLHVPNPILNKLWVLTTVAISAQIATFPLSIYYFHQFPVYFLLSGYIVILMAGILIYLSILLFLLSPIAEIAAIIASILKILVQVMNACVIWIHQLPGAVIHQLSFSKIQVLLLYAILCSIILVLIVKRKYAIFSFLILLIAYQVDTVYENWQQSKNRMIVFNAGKNSLIAFQKQDQVVFLQDKDLSKIKLQRLISNYLVVNQIEKYKIDTLADIELRTFSNRSFFIVGNKAKMSEAIFNQLTTDFVIVRKNGLHNLDSLTNFPLGNQVIFDASISNRDLKRLHYHADTEKNIIYSVKNKGALICDLSSEL